MDEISLSLLPLFKGDEKGLKIWMRGRRVAVGVRGSAARKAKQLGTSERPRSPQRREWAESIRTVEVNEPSTAPIALVYPDFELRIRRCSAQFEERSTQLRKRDYAVAIEIKPIKCATAHRLAPLLRGERALAAGVPATVVPAPALLLFLLRFIEIPLRLRLGAIGNRLI